MLITVVLLTTIWIQAYGSELPATHLVAPVVTAASSQYFERTFNRLVAAPALQPVIPVLPSPPVVQVEPVTKTTVQVPNPTQNVPVQPNVAIAVATAHAAAPVATILLPPFPFGLPPGFVPFQQPINVSDNNDKEQTTEPTTKKEPELTTPIPSSSNNNFMQALPLNENTKFKKYYAPPLPAQVKPQKLKTSIEVEKVPLTYIAPPPMVSQPLKHVHTFVPARAKIVIRPARLRVRTIRVPAGLVIRGPLSSRYTIPRNVPRFLKPLVRKDTEPTTFRPLNNQNTKPPRV